MSKTLTRLAAVAALGMAAATANANIVSLSPLQSVVAVGQEVEVEVRMDFLDLTVGGGIDLFYDSGLLSFVSFEFDADFLANVADPDFTYAPDNCFADGATFGGCSVGDGELNGLGVGSFDGITGLHVIGTAVFEALDLGASIISLAATDSDLGPFISAVDASELIVAYNQAKVRVVPVPAAVWLLLSAMAPLLLRRRRAA